MAKNTKTTGTYTFLGETYDLDKAIRADLSTKNVPLCVHTDFGQCRAITTIWFDDNVYGFGRDNALGPTPRAAIRNLERKCIQEFKRMAKACGYTVTG